MGQSHARTRPCISGNEAIEGAQQPATVFGSASSRGRQGDTRVQIRAYVLSLHTLQYVKSNLNWAPALNSSLVSMPEPAMNVRVAVSSIFIPNPPERNAKLK